MAGLRIVYRLLAAARAPQLARLARPGAPVFCLHNVVAPEHAGVGDTSLHMASAEFQAFVDWACDRHELVPLAEVCRRARAGLPLGGLAAITFDDAYSGIFRHAIPHLKAKGVPCTVFVVSGFGVQPRHTWWDRLAGAGLLTDARRERALGVQRGLAAEVLADVPDASPGTPLPDDLLPATWEALRSAMGQGVEVGSHTVRHPNLAALTPDEILLELTGSRDAIGDRLGHAPDAVAYPYGRLGPAVVEAARRAGYRAGFTLEPRQVRSVGEALLSLPRLNVPAGVPLEALDCWSAGINPRRWLGVRA